MRWDGQFFAEYAHCYLKLCHLYFKGNFHFGKKSNGISARQYQVILVINIRNVFSRRAQWYGLVNKTWCSVAEQFMSSQDLLLSKEMSITKLLKRVREARLLRFYVCFFWICIVWKKWNYRPRKNHLSLLRISLSKAVSTRKLLPAYYWKLPKVLAYSAKNLHHARLIQ